jgi:transposase-like protein
MSKCKSGYYSKEFKLAAISRVLSGEDITTLALELGVRRNRLYDWRAAYVAGGAEAFRSPGRPRKDSTVVGARSVRVPSGTPPSGLPAEGVEQALSAARRRIVELERKIGQQALEADFFTEALQHFEASRQPSDRPGETASTASSRRRRSGKAIKGED